MPITLTKFDSSWEGERCADSAGPSQRDDYLHDEDRQRQMPAAEGLRSQDDVEDVADLLEGIRYTVEWTALLKTKRIGMDTEQDIDLASEAFWETTLHKKVRDSLERSAHLENAQSLATQ